MSTTILTPQLPGALSLQLHQNRFQPVTVPLFCFAISYSSRSLSFKSFICGTIILNRLSGVKLGWRSDCFTVQ